MSTSAQQTPPLTATVERRFYPRIVPQTPVFVAFSDHGESLLLNLSENGLLLSTPTELRCNSVARLSIPLIGLPKSVQVTARVVWSSEARNLAGIQLLDLSEHDRHLIRKWGSRESTKFWQPAPADPVLADPPPTSSSEMRHAAHATPAFAEDAPLPSPRDIVPIAPALTVRARPHPLITRRMLRIALLATACLAAMVLLIKAAPSNPFARSKQNRAEAAAAPVAQNILPSSAIPENPGTSKPALPSQAPLPARAATPAKSKTPLEAESSRATSPQIEQATAHDDSASAATANPQNPRDDSPTESVSPSQPTPDPSTIAEVPKEAEPEALPVSPNPPTPAQPLPNPTRPNNIPSAASATIPAAPLASPSTNSIVAPVRPALSPKSAGPVNPPVIQMDAPRNQTLEVHLPSGYQAPFFNLPGERVLESPSVTIHIQRSVHLPATHSGWPFNRNKKVLVGELISRVDPQAAQIPSASANSVRVKATVSKDGHIENVKLILGPANLVPAVAQALHEWRYQPTLVDDKPVETQCYVVFQFHPPSYRAAKR
jgi:hypothetical protein